jgi:hypothetical protein
VGTSINDSPTVGFRVPYKPVPTVEVDCSSRFASHSEGSDKVHHFKQHLYQDSEHVPRVCDKFEISRFFDFTSGLMENVVWDEAEKAGFWKQLDVKTLKTGEGLGLCLFV